MKEITSEDLRTNLILQLKNSTYGVVKNEDGTITLINDSGQPCPNAGSVIISQGGVEATLLKCHKSTETFGEIIAKQAAADNALRQRLNYVRARIDSIGQRLDIGTTKLAVVDGTYLHHKGPKGWQLITEERYLEIKEREEPIVNAILTNYNNLLQTSNGVIETTSANLAIVMKYLNIHESYTWTLPAMSIGYSANQYDCDGKLATTIKLDHPMPGDDETKFVLGAPIGHLNQYQRVR